MDKVSKMNMFYDLANAQGIRVAVNTGTYSSYPAPLVVTISATTPSLTLAITYSDLVLEVDHLLDSETILTVGEPTSPLVSKKRPREEEHPSPRIDASPKRTRVVDGDASRKVNTFIKI